MDEIAPLNQTMKIQLDVCAVVSPNCSETAIWSGTAPNAYHTNAVRPAQRAAVLKSRVNPELFTCELIIPFTNSLESQWQGLQSSPSGSVVP